MPVFPGAFHAGAEIYGVEWSYGYNDDDASGIFPSPPKYCEMHDYKETHYVGDTTLTPLEFERWLQFLSRQDYKQEDPLDPNFPKRAPKFSETPRQFFGEYNIANGLPENHKRYTDMLNPITKEADIGGSYTPTDSTRMWTTFEDVDGNKVVSRIGFWCAVPIVRVLKSSLSYPSSQPCSHSAL